MASLLIGGSKDQEWINRGARDRAEARYAKTISFALLVALIFALVGDFYLGSLPRERAVPIVEQRDGSWMPYSTQAPDILGEQHLLADWVAGWRLGSSDPQSLQARQVAALLLPPSGGSNDVVTEVQSYNQQLADRHLTVAPTVRYVNCSGYDCEMDWDETVTDGLRSSQHAMRAYVTIAFDDAHVNLHNDPLMNPYGMVLRTLRVVEVGRAH
jgi:hypothetical protein